MMSYINETDFVIENKELVYPEIITDGLQLYYDAKGKRDTDYHRDTMLDMSGNKNHGKLHNFSYEKHSGYKDGLVFDYIDDKLVRPALSLKPDDFTFMLNGNIISFSPDGTVKRVQDGEVIENKGFNLLQNGDFSDGSVRWASLNSSRIVEDGYLTSIGDGSLIYPQVYRSFNYDHSSKYYLMFKYKTTARRIVISTGTFSLSRVESVPIDSPDVWHTYSTQFTPDTGTASLRVYHSYSDSNSANGGKLSIDDVMLVDLTATFGAGNEPTKEQMDEIINRFGFVPNAQDLIDRREYKGNDLGDMENIIDGLYKTEVLSGQELYTTEPDDAVVHVEIDGKSYQRFNPNARNMVPTKYEDWVEGYHYGMGDGTPEVHNNRMAVPWLIEVESSKSYYINTGNPNISYVIRTYDSSKTIEAGSWGGSGSSGVKTTYSTTKYLGVGLFTSTPGVSVKDEFQAGNIKPIIQDSSIADRSFIEYIPKAPTPDSPIEIHSLNDFDVVSSAARQNLLKGTSSSSARVSIGQWTGSLSAQVLYINDGVIDVGDTITLSAYIDSPTGVRTAVRLTEYFTDGSNHVGVVGNYITKGYSEVTMTVGANNPNVNYIVAHMPNINNGTPYSVNVSHVKIEKGSSSTPYLPAPEDITEDTNHPLIDKINILLDEPLRSVGDVKDKLFRDSDGVWKIERNTKEVSFGVDLKSTKDDTDTATPSGLKAYFVGGYSGIRMNGNTTHINSTHFAYNTRENKGYGAKLNHIGMNGASGVWAHNLYFAVSEQEFPTLESFNDWLIEQEDNGAPVKIQVQSRTEDVYTEILSQSLQDKLNNLRSFSDSNYVYTVDGNTNLLDTVPLLNNHWYPHVGVQQDPEERNGQTATKDAISVYPGAQIRLTKRNAGENHWRIVWVDKNNNLILRITPMDNDLTLTVPNGTYGMRVSYYNGAEPVIKFDKSPSLSKNLKPTLHAKFLYNNWYKEDRVINNLMIYNRALTNEEMLQNYTTIKRRWGM